MRVTIGLVFVASVLLGPVMATAQEVKAAVLRVDYPDILPVSRFDVPADDDGFAGGFVATADNQTTGTFMGQEYLTEYVATTPEGAAEAMDALLAQDIKLFVLLANAEDTLALTDQAGEGALVFNAGARDVALRNDQCRANLLHTTPSTAMLTDAVAQFTVLKKWTDWFMVFGSNPEDIALADAYRNSARKYGARIVEERQYDDTGESQRSDSGHILVQRQLPIFTQNAEDHDVVIAADGSDYFGEYLTYHVWDPRPVMGGGGLRPVSFTAANEAWGATQLQNRFEKHAGRYITERDFDTWVALRAVGEAVTRTNSADPMVIRDYLLGEDFELASFKGGAVTFRDWNGQLRQPIILGNGRIIVSVSPQDGFLHQVSPLDSMGIDRAESTCTAFN